MSPTFSTRIYRNLTLLRNSYFKAIKSPMDVGKMLRKLDRGLYQSLGAIAKDLEQIVWKYVLNSSL